MSEQVQPSPDPTPPGATPTPPRRPRFMAALPFVITAVAAVVFSLSLQALLFPRASDPSAIIQTPTAAAANLPSRPAPTAATAPSEAAPTQNAIPDERLIRLELLDLETEDRRLWGMIYLLRAASQIDDAITALQVNDLSETDRTLMAARRSLDRAYAVTLDAERGPIDSLRLELSRIRDDLGPRPEGADRRLRQLRRLVLGLVDEG